MTGSTFTFNNADGIKVFVYKWLPETEPKAVVQISHGMVENAERYERFAELLTKEGYGVYANDHLGHGKTSVNIEEIGNLGKCGFGQMVATVHELTQLIKKENPTLKVFLFGHSMGSFISQRFIQEYGDELAGVVLSGTAGPTAGVGLVKKLAGFQCSVKGEASRAKFLTKLQFGGFNKAFAPNRTEFDWLSRDTSEVDKYIQNKYCGAVTTAGFVYTIADGLSSLHTDEVMNKVPKGLPIHVIVGEMDPVGGQTKTVRWLLDKYKAIGINDVTYQLYSGGRHELLNETNRDEVMHDVVTWLNQHC